MQFTLKQFVLYSSVIVLMSLAFPSKSNAQDCGGATNHWRPTVSWSYHVSIVHLLTERVAFDGKRIHVTGYLAEPSGSGLPHLYLNERDNRLRNEAASVLVLDGEWESPKTINDCLDGYVSVTGTWGQRALADGEYAIVDVEMILLHDLEVSYAPFTTCWESAEPKD